MQVEDRRTGMEDKKSGTCDLTMTRTIIMTEEDGQELIQSFWQIGLLRRPPLTQEVVPLTLLYCRTLLVTIISFFIYLFVNTVD